VTVVDVTFGAAVMTVPLLPVNWLSKDRERPRCQHDRAVGPVDVDMVELGHALG
jgi:hypothetical protein